MGNIHPDDREAAGAVLAELADGKHVIGFECRHICADGAVRWLEWKTHARPEEGVAYGLAEDVTDRRAASAEMDALRRVATLVAGGVQPQDLFAVVAEEVSRVVDIPAVSVVRYELDGTATECANFNRGEKLFPVGVRWSIEGTNILRLVRDSSAAARINDYSGLEGEMAAIVRRSGIRSTVGIPIVVAGRVWGTMVGSTTEPDALPEDTESRLADFTELLASAIGNAESRDALERLADEQAALRRVATLVTQGVRPAKIFSAVSDEVGRLVGAVSATVIRYDDDGEGIGYVGSASKVSGAFPVGVHWKFQEGMASFDVYRSGRSARSGAHLITVDGPIGDIHRRMGIVSAVASPIVVEGHLWGAMAVQGQEPLPLDTEERLEKFTELLATAIANAESKSELAASRRRIVAAWDEARRRIERDLHDGTQQRLVSLSLALRAAEANLPPDRDALRSELSSIAVGLADAVDDLQELSRGIHPAILSQGGLGAALRTLARRSMIPVELDVRTQTRLPEPIEVAAYFIASEAVANATKHAQASHIEVSLVSSNGSLLLSIRDHGIGGAAPSRGSGLVGLTDRVEALGGTIDIQSPPGGGTSLFVTLPLDAEPTQG
jgi:signal transduction histidine kinase